MKILHISNDFASSKVHSNLFFELDRLGVNQMIYTYFGSTRFYSKNRFDGDRTIFLYSKKLVKCTHRLFYQYKIYSFFKDLLNQIDPLEYDCVNATTLFSDGALAYQLYQKYHIPYIVTVRSTDIRVFLKYMPHTWAFGRNILKNASKIIFVSKSSLYEFKRVWALKDLIERLSSKFIFQPNGIDDFWLEHICHVKQMNNNIIYVGQLVYRKNVLKLISAVLKIQKVMPDIRLSIVGGGGNCEKKVLRRIESHSDIIKYYGKIDDKDKLKEIYRMNSIFAMPSVCETFGLTYLEAISQNLSILYTRDEGFDGIIDEKVGEAVMPNVNDIVKGLMKIMLNRSIYKNNEAIDFDQYRWSFIAKKYLKIYESIIL